MSDLNAILRVDSDYLLAVFNSMWRVVGGNFSRDFHGQIYQ